MANQNMGALIANLRKAKGMTQKDLAERMNVTDKAVSKWERNLSCPDVNSIPRLAEVLGIGVEELMTAAPKQEEKQDTEVSIVSLVLKAIPVAMGAAVTILSVIGRTDTRSVLCMLGIGVFCLGLSQLPQSERYIKENIDTGIGASDAGKFMQINLLCDQRPRASG